MRVVFWVVANVLMYFFGAFVAWDWAWVVNLGDIDWLARMFIAAGWYFVSVMAVSLPG